jgi:spore germination protein YaaH
MARTAHPLVVSVVLLAVTFLGTAVPVSGAATQAAEVGPRTASAWLPYWDLQRSYRRVVDNADVFGTASPFWYDAGCTTVTGHVGAGDRMRVMGYDQHANGTRPGPIAGYPWVSAVVRYAASTAPSGKVELGIPLYGRDWTGRRATSLSATQARALARAHSVRPRFDPDQRESTFRYVSGGRRHTVWYSGPRSVGARVTLARRQGLAGVAFWAPGMESGRTWAVVRSRSR